MDKIYIVKLHDYDRCDDYGYFDTYEKAKECCDYLNAAHPSDYDFEWEIERYSLDTTDYAALNKEYNAEQKRIADEKAEAFKQQELAELARLKAKYEGG